MYVQKITIAEAEARYRNKCNDSWNTVSEELKINDGQINKDKHSTHECYSRWRVCGLLLV